MKVNSTNRARIAQHMNQLDIAADNRIARLEQRIEKLQRNGHMPREVKQNKITELRQQIKAIYAESGARGEPIEPTTFLGSAIRNVASVMAMPIVAGMQLATDHPFVAAGLATAAFVGYVSSAPVPTTQKKNPLTCLVKEGDTGCTLMNACKENVDVVHSNGTYTSLAQNSTIDLHAGNNTCDTTKRILFSDAGAEIHRGGLITTPNDAADCLKSNFERQDSYLTINCDVRNLCSETVDVRVDGKVTQLKTGQRMEIPRDHRADCSNEGRATFANKVGRLAAASPRC